MKVGLETTKDAAKELEIKTKMKSAGFFECYILGLGIALGGFSSSLWQKTLGSGVYGGLISTLILMVGYYMLDMSLSEMVGVVPFAGGAFGFVRCSLGPTAGFLAASAEMCVYAFYSIRTIQKMAKMVTFMALTRPELEKLWAFVAYLSVLVFHLRGGAWFWNTMIGCTFFTIVLLCIFFIASWTSVDFHRYALGHDSTLMVNDGFIGTADEFMQYLYYPAWFFMGICALPLTGARVKNESVVIPRAIMAAMTTMSVVAILGIFTVASHTPGIGTQLLEKTSYVLEYGLQDALGIPERYVPCLLLVPTYASATGFMFVCKHQLCSMAESGLMPAIFKKRFGPNNIPIFSVLWCTLIQYAIYLVVDHYEPENDIAMLFRFTLTAACFMYMGVMVAFIAFRTKFGNMKRQFVSPVGIPGAVLGILIFFFVLVSLLGYQKDDYAGPLAFMGFIVLMMTYYFAYVQYTQFFSKEEQDKFMKAYILNANKRKKNNRWVKFMNSVLATIDWMMCGIPSKISSKRSGSKTSKSCAGVSSIHNNSLSKNELSMAESIMPVVVASKKIGQEPNIIASTTIASTATEGSHVPRKSRTGSLLRSSFATGAASLGWSGKHMEDHQSRKAFAILTAMSRDDNEDAETMQVEQNDDETAAAKVAERLIEQFPDHFVPVAGDDKLATALQAVVQSAPFASNDVEGGGMEMVRAAENTKECDK